MNKIVKVGVANESEKNLEVEVVQKWGPTNIFHSGDTVYFEHDKTFYSMKRIDFQNIFKK
jgi:hypothetical protein